MDDKIILDTSDKAATFRTDISGWVSKSGRYYGKDERIARWDGCTHMKCDLCGVIYPKGYSKCDLCSEKARHDQYVRKELVSWDKKTPLYSESVDRYFYDIDDIDDYLDCHLDRELSTLDLVLCDPVYLQELDYDHFVDDLPEDGELPDEALEALEKFNEILRQQGPVSWQPSNKAVMLTI